MPEEQFNETVCKYHSGIVEQIKSFNFFAKLAMVIFVLIGMGVVGFLWHGQSILSEKVEANHIDTMKGIAALDKAVSQIEVKFDAKFHEFFKSSRSTNSERDRQSEKK